MTLVVVHAARRILLWRHLLLFHHFFFASFSALNSLRYQRYATLVEAIRGLLGWLLMR